jgi:hypothetical protein
MMPYVPEEPRLIGEAGVDRLAMVVGEAKVV